MFKVGDFVYCSGGFSGAYFGRITNIDEKHVCKYEIQPMYYSTGQPMPETEVRATSEVRNGYDVINDEVIRLCAKQDILNKMKIKELQNEPNTEK